MDVLKKRQPHLFGNKIILQFANDLTLQKIIGYILRKFPGNNNDLPVIIVRNDYKKFQTMSTFCQHESGSVQGPISNKAIYNLHQLQYSVSDGNFWKNIGGQSAPNLQTFVTEFNESKGIISITF